MLSSRTPDVLNLLHLAIAYSPRGKKREKEPVKEYMDGLKNVNRKSNAASSYGEPREIIPHIHKWFKIV
jgi:hypothetical protein